MAAVGLNTTASTNIINNKGKVMLNFKWLFKKEEKKTRRRKKLGAMLTPMEKKVFQAMLANGSTSIHDWEREIKDHAFDLNSCIRDIREKGYTIKTVPLHPEIKGNRQGRFVLQSFVNK